MKAVRLQARGGPDQLRYKDAPAPCPAPATPWSGCMPAESLRPSWTGPRPGRRRGGRAAADPWPRAVGRGGRSPAGRPGPAGDAVFGLTERQRSGLHMAGAGGLGREVFRADGGELGQGSRRARLLREQWARWDPGVPLQVLHTEYASVARPVVAFIDDLRERERKQVIVLIPVIIRTGSGTGCCTTTST